MSNKCENCIHYDLCVELMAHANNEEKDFIKELLSESGGCADHYKDKSLFVELPCKVGDKVYSIIECSCEDIDGVHTECEFYGYGIDDRICTITNGAKCPY